MYVGTHSSDTEETILAAFPKCTRQRSRGLCLCLSSQSSSWVGLISDKPKSHRPGREQTFNVISDWPRLSSASPFHEPLRCHWLDEVSRASLVSEPCLVWYESCFVGLRDAVGRRTPGGWTCSWGLSNHRLLWRAPSSPRCYDSTTHKSTKPPLLDKATQTSSLSLSNMKSGLWMPRCLIPALYELIWAGWRY